MKIIESLKSNFLSLLITIGTLWLLESVFGIDLFNLGILIVGFLITFLIQFNKRLTQNQNHLNILFAGISLIVSFLFFNNPINIIVFLLGCNLAAIYVQTTKLKDGTFDISIANVVGLSNILLFSGIEKFRGANKLDEGDIQLTIPLIILISLMMYVLNLLAYSALSKKFTKHIKAKITMVSYLVYVTLLFIVTFPVYKEVGSDVIFVPLLAGIIAGLMRSFIKPRSVFNEILEVVLCVMLPFQIAGFMGVGLSILTFYLCYSMVGVLINNFKTANMLSIVKLSPLLYLLASQEIRENKGLINRLDITNGYQLGWILICLILVKFVALYYQPFLDWLEKNELSKFIQTLVPLFTLVIFVIIIRLGRAEGAIALITSFVAFLYIYNLFEKRLHREQLRLTSSLAQFAGTLTFLVLTTF